MAKGPVVLTLSMLAALRNGVPSLVQYDDAGRVLATGDRVPQGPIVVQPNAIAQLVVTLTAGTESLELKRPNSKASAATVQVVGQESGWVYLPVTSMTGAGDFKRTLQVDTATDQHLLVTVDNSADPLNVGTVFVTLVKAVDEVTIFSAAGQEPAVNLLGVPDAIKPPTAPAYFRGTIGAGGTQTLIAGVAGADIKLYGFSLRSEAAAGAPVVFLERDDGVGYWSTDFSVVVDKTFDFHGFLVPRPRSVRLRASALTPGLDVTLLYRQE